MQSLSSVHGRTDIRTQAKRDRARARERGEGESMKSMIHENFNAVEKISVISHANSIGETTI